MVSFPPSETIQIIEYNYLNQKSLEQFEKQVKKNLWYFSQHTHFRCILVVEDFRSFAILIQKRVFFPQMKSESIIQIFQ